MTERMNSASAEPEVLPARLPPDVAEAALAFLGRVPDIHASEIEAFLRVRVALEAIVLGAR